MRTRNKILLGIGTLLFLPVFGGISLVAVGYGYLVYNVHTYTEDLNLVDSAAYTFCKNISLNTKFTQGPMYFRVDKGSVVVSKWKAIYPEGALAVTPVGLWPYHKTIILTEEALKSEYLDVIVAHELGHIQNASMDRESANLKEMEQQADAFAAEIVGSQRVLGFRLGKSNH